MTDLDASSAMDAAVAEVRRVYMLALAQAGAVDLGSLLVSSLPIPALFGMDALSSGQSASLGNLRTLGDQVDRWSSVLRSWAEAGRRDDGSTYTAAGWLAYGKDLASAAATYAGTSWDASLFAVALNTAEATGSDLAHVVNPFAWSTTTKILVGAAVGLVALAVLTPYLRTAHVLA